MSQDHPRHRKTQSSIIAIIAKPVDRKKVMGYVGFSNHHLTHMSQVR